MGGSVVYAAADEEEPLARVEPSENALSLIYRTCDTARFVERVNRRAERLNSRAAFYDLCYSYREPEESEEEVASK